MDNNDALIQKPIGRATVRFAIPLLLANILQMLYSMVDMYIVGRFAHTADVSAVSSASALLFVLTITVSGFSTGVSVLVGQNAGAKNHENISRTSGTGIILFAGISVVVIVPLLVFCRPVVSLLNAPAGAEQETYEYLFICLCGLVFAYGYNLVTCILRGMGNSRAPFVIVAISSVFNVVTDYILVKVCALGAAGAAWATIASQLLSFILAIIYWRVKGAGFHLQKEHIRYDKSFAKQIAKIGVPLAFQEFLVNLSFVFITAIINGYGMAASAAGGITEKIIVFICMPTTAFAAAVATASAQNIGAKQPKRARQSMWIAIAICLCFTTLVNIITFFRGEWLIKIFTQDPDVIENGRLYIRSYGFDQMMLAVVFIMNSFFNACGHSVFTMVHSLITTFCIRVPMVWLISRIAGSTLLHIGIAAPVSSFVSLVLCVIFLFLMKKKDAAILTDSL